MGKTKSLINLIFRLNIYEDEIIKITLKSYADGGI